MKRAILMAMVLLVGGGAASAQDITGDWVGALQTGAVELHLVVHVRKSPDGNLTATLDSIDQGAMGIPVSAISLKDSVFKLEVAAVRGVYQGTVNKAATEIDGTWSQGGANLPLVLKRAKNSSELLPPARPQTPHKPYPYRQEEVAYENKAQNVKLAGTLTIPEGKGPFPAVLLIPGSGPHDRDETIFGHKPFLVLADYFTRKGIAVLRYDDRGVGKSTGSLVNATTADLSTDAEAGFAYLSAQPEVEPGKVGLIGHSEGGLIAAMVAARNPKVAFIVMMAGPGVRGDEILVQQVLMLNQAAGMSREAAEKAAAEERSILNLVESGKENSALDEKLQQKLEGVVPAGQVQSTIATLTSPWFRYFISYEPAVALRRVKCPVLALIGEKDKQVSVAQNLPAIREALEQGGNQDFDVEEMPGLNHLFQPAKTGGVNEYATIQETIAPVALEKIASWILKQSR
ncbi:MAG: alpha/beta hydrolase family protein [Candidatus Acidiferrales bacterium]